MIVGSTLFIGFAGKIESRRADSNRLPLLITSDRSCVAGACTGMQSRISTPVSFLRVAACCTVLRSRWYQNRVEGNSPISLQVRFGRRPFRNDVAGALTSL